MAAIGLLASWGPAFADTEVGGAITEDTIWGPNSPTIPDTVYIVVADVTVEAGVTLTVEPQVTVRFQPNRCLDVSGTLRALGSQGSQEVLFTSDEVVPQRGDWGRICGREGGLIELSGSVVQYGGARWPGAVCAYNADLSLTECVVRYSSRMGIYVRYDGWNGTPGYPRLTDCEVYENYSAGKDARGMGQEGFYGDFAGGSQCSPIVEGCLFYSNGLENMEFWYVGSSSGSPQITDCASINSGEDGIQTLYQASTGYPVLRRCYLAGTPEPEAAFEYNYENGAVGHATVIDCQFAGNFMAVFGEYSEGSQGWPLFTGCTVEGPGHGIQSKFSNEGSGTLTLENCIFDGLGWGIDVIDADGALVRGCVVSGSAGATNSNGINLYNSGGIVDQVTSIGNERSGLFCSQVPPTIVNSLFAYNSRYGVESDVEGTPTVSYCCFWENAQGNTSHEFPGGENIFADPEFMDYEAGDYRLSCSSPCVDTGDPDTPPVDGTRIDIGALQFGGTTTAPDPEPYGDAALFGEPDAGFPGWVWFSIPFHPCGSAQPPDVLGFDCSGAVFRWDKYGKHAQVYRAPFLTWDLVPGESYLLYLTERVLNPSYLGENPTKPLEVRLGKMGWTWLGMPANVIADGDDFMASVQVKYPSDETGETRTAQQDFDATPDNWIAWGWAFLDTGTQSPKTFTPYAPFGSRDCHPWLGYRAWVNVGAAVDEHGPDQVTLIWP